MSADAIIVVPCYNEELRLDGDALLRLAAEPGVQVLFVDDGSRDRTLARLQELAATSSGRARVLALPENRGKAEAVRQGLLKALSEAPRAVAYLDADLSTPAEEMLRLLRFLDESDVSFVMGARVALLGYRIERKTGRHYLGRLFASMASVILQMRVYDTQCGAKVARPSPALEAALSQPFLSRWAFDVELIGRLLAGGEGVGPLPLAAFAEVPLEVWRDVAGSKLSPRAMARALSDLARIAADLKGRRARGPAAPRP